MTAASPTGFRAMVASPHALASQAGADVIKAGGSAVDAAIASSAALSVLYPPMTSVGGDAFWLIWDARRRQVRFLNGAGRAAAAATLDWFRQRGLGEIPVRGIVPATLTVPGAVDSWCEAHAEYGRLTLAEDLAAAIHYARGGFEVTERIAEWIAGCAEVLAANPEAASIFLPGGAAPRGGQRLINGDLALTLERIGPTVAPGSTTARRRAR
ncbi:MAG TPA: gamma-glutamyltransferase [Methylomirabilota bacterium]|nr:gamma-glutamyltransferase [Methylomirabilota bacterium]